MQQYDLSWADAGHGDPAFLSEIFGLALVRDIAPLEALRRVGGLEDTVADRTPAQIVDLHNFDDGYPEVASALSLGEWTVLVQPNSFWLRHLVDALSRGTEAVAIVRHDYASPNFTHAVDGTVTTSFNLNYPDQRGGTDPDRLLPLIREAGFDPDTVDDGDDDDDDESWLDRYENVMARALRLTGLITGVLPTYEQITEPLPSMHFDRWFSRTRPSDVEDALATATGLVAELNVGDTPGLAAALAAAGRGEPVVVTPDSDLGRHVREWSTLASRAGWSLNLDRGRLTDEEGRRGGRFGHLTQALAAAFRADLA
ncbi:hypothetical protein SAMN04488564_101933 [Lentzea waywayandensis]|uniref:Uncharacterized protein n=1 Tax=Lentzea waywayandensis TaxID=84724 RepID=A0A1I6D385_9PSEU|nr:DUF6461 domain-containing protein [Lentzea waywayandensis]SFQ99813.1 hypothetical protein SAMN04488564_101933 [Lentzea waywayandensis]